MNVFYTNTMGELYNSPRKFEEGTIAISGEDQKQYCYTGNEWVMVGTTTNNLSDNSTTFQTGMNLYDFNKNISATIGSNNIFNRLPSRSPDISSLTADNQFVYSRQVSQYGIGGRFVFARVEFKF